jgi:hypothetical protein
MPSPQTPLPSLEEVGRERGEERIRKERDRVVSLFFIEIYGSLSLSATNGNRVPETVIKVKRKPASAVKHIGRNSMLMSGISQEFSWMHLGKRLRYFPKLYLKDAKRIRHR